MKYVKKSRQATLLKSRHEEPLNGVANLFDVSLVFIVALLLTLMSTFQVLDFFNPDSEITVMKKVKDQWQIITKKGKDIKVKKVTNKRVGGDEGFKLGTAYQLKNGRIVYIPEEKISEID
ncbi:DUF2149 domain-containing protein [Desulfosarcina ovata]|uniref:DUF2149 domain-containing protein n=1 Tax=Desulfosarcina ovata subsp. ovata TaxID=2752305 RepID=A0A5K8A682_9BACT|nr:DUF2149 domain-containing protein [Desulfosarcina ovata]BBO87894.1 hypothetical protein DSCOOX_10740 [Desulfosarcina ovata subsp. ovata]